MKKWIIPIAVLATAIPFTASAEKIMVGGASAGGEYNKTLIPAFSSQLQKDGTKYTAEAVVTAGSVECVSKLLSGELNFCVAQKDIAAAAYMEDQDGDESLGVYGNLGLEALLCAVKVGGRFNGYFDLADDHEKPLKISVGKEGGGTEGTIMFLDKQDDGFQEYDKDTGTGNVRLMRKKSLVAELGSLASGNRDAVCRVISPNPENEFLRLVADNKHLKFINMVNSDWKHYEINGQKIYDFAEVPITPGFVGFGSDKVTTLVTWSTLVAHTENAPEDQLNAMARAALQDGLVPLDSLAAKANALYKEGLDISSFVVKKFSSK